MESPDDALREWLRNNFYAFGQEDDVVSDADNLIAWMHRHGYYFERIPHLEQRPSTEGSSGTEGRE